MSAFLAVKEVPKSCKACVCVRSEYGGESRSTTFECKAMKDTEFKDGSISRPEWCPIVEEKAFEVIDDSLNSFATGWNACLEYLKGEQT